MRLLSIGWLLLAVLLGPQAAAKSPADNFAQQAQANAYPLTLSADGTLSGVGAELIAREAAQAQFFMIGEQHATAGIAKVNLGLHRLAAGQGYNHAALEIGPDSTLEIERLVRSGKGQLASFIRQPRQSFVFPFLGWAEETALVEQIVYHSPAKSPVLWGIDQEFVGSAPLHLSRLRSWAGHTSQKRVLADLSAKASADPLLIGMMDPAAYDRLRSAFPRSRHPEAARLIDDLAASTAIYAPFAGKGGSRQAANVARESMLKQQFLRHFRQAEASLGRPPKVFFKFGANHAMRGHSLSDVPALGNFLAEWGLSRGFSMLNVAVDCIGGEQSDLRTGQRSP